MRLGVFQPAEIDAYYRGNSTYTNVLPLRVGFPCDFAYNTAVHTALAGYRVGRCERYVRRLFQKRHFQIELFRHSLRRRVTVSRPNDVFDVQPFAFPRFPNADLYVYERI